MKLVCIAFMALALYSCHSKSIVHRNAFPGIQQHFDKSGSPMLLGVQSKQALEQAPYKEWFRKNYEAYTMDTVTANELKPHLKNKHFEIFMGTWCGDSRRELPRMLKVLEYAGVEASRINIVMVDNRDSVYKQSPGHEEKDKNIFRVPDLIVYNGKQEINRIIEAPVASIEKDLLAITDKNNYQPNYMGGLYLANEALHTPTKQLEKDSAMLVGKLKTITASSSELNSLGYVWMAAGEVEKALLAFQLNAMLFPDDANVYDSLGKINWKLGRNEQARKYYQRVLNLQPANENAAKMLLQLK